MWPPLHCWWECKLIQSLWRIVWRFLRKLKIEVPYDPTISLLGIFPEKIIIKKDICTPIFTAALFTVARARKSEKSESVRCSAVSYSLRPHGLWSARLLCPWNSPGKHTGVGSHSFLQRIFPTQGSNLGFSHYRWILYCLSQIGSLIYNSQDTEVT